ncbi:hypothetical protein GCM10010393_33450 [Streptomyces gobitricini]|uniref:Uncharacterized protein n=1 Tax=Streptomyces gobitricini TaxID=68211 RepID=A0ABN3MCT2_9ACTN
MGSAGRPRPCPGAQALRERAEQAGREGVAYGPGSQADERDPLAARPPGSAEPAGTPVAGSCATGIAGRALRVARGVRAVLCALLRLRPDRAARPPPVRALARSLARRARSHDGSPAESRASRPHHEKVCHRGGER